MSLYEKLKEYVEKRNFSITPEPKGKKSKNKGHLSFVIQEHHASHLHYDFRLEIEGVLKSWAVPKGIPVEANAKHLAIVTEDHPLEYANFEGHIPKGEYGGGEVKIWDRGIYENRTYNQKGELTSLDKALKEGHIQFSLLGKKLKNELFILQRFQTGKKEQWLLIKR